MLTRALQEYGRLNKTIFILRYLLSEQVQRRIGTQINKGEALHAFRGFLFLPNEGKIRRRYHEEQLNQASCLIGNQPSQDFSQPSTLEELSAILQFPKLALV